MAGVSLQRRFTLSQELWVTRLKSLKWARPQNQGSKNRLAQKELAAHLAIEFPDAKTDMPIAGNGRYRRNNVKLMDDAIFSADNCAESVHIALIAGVWLQQMPLFWLA